MADDMKWLDDLLGVAPRISDEYLKRSQEALNQAYSTAESKVKGAATGRYNQGIADIGTTAIKGGFKGSPVEAALQRKLGADINAATQEKVESLASKKATEEAGLQKEYTKIKLQEDTARAQARSKLLRSAIGGIGGVIGEFTANTPQNMLNVEGEDLFSGLSQEDQLNYLLA